MKEIVLTCPFTGCEFTALKDSDGCIYAKHQLTGEDIKLDYYPLTNEYIIPAHAFTHIATVTPSQAVEILGVSRQRISAIMATNAIRPVLVNDQQRFILDDVLKYKETRKVGAPKKE